MLDERIQHLLSPTVTAMGYELVGVERLSNSSRGTTLLRVIIDQETGICIEDCEKVSHQISSVLDVENPLQERYTLEVSSPGLDRLLFTLAHFQRFTGHRVQVRLNRPLPNTDRRKLVGDLLAVEDETIILLVDGIRYSLMLSQIDKARLVPDL